MRYKFATDQSRFMVHSFSVGVLSAYGHNPNFAVRRFSGEMEFTARLYNEAFVKISADSTSLELTDSIKADEHAEIMERLHKQVLQPDQFPQIEYASTKISPLGMVAENWFRIRIEGTLKLHGVSKPHPLDAQARILDDQLRLSADTILKQSDYRIPLVSALGGMISMKDDVKLSFELVGLPN